MTLNEQSTDRDYTLTAVEREVVMDACPAITPTVGDHADLFAAVERLFGGQVRANRIASAANYPGLVTELFGFLGAAINDGRTLDPRDLHEHLRDLKRRYVTEPVMVAIADSMSTPTGADDGE